MFLDVTRRRNPALIAAAVRLHQSGKLEPDTYVVDLDAVLQNARLMLAEAERNKIKLYCMTKQLGRNPFVAGHLIKLGFNGAVAVDYREAEVLAENGIPLGNVGHLVQVPSRLMEKMVARKPEVITVYSVNKAREVSDAAQKLGVQQSLLLRVVGEHDMLYAGQFGGFRLTELAEAAKAINALPNVRLRGVTAFPCLLYSAAKQDLEVTPNLYTLLQAKELLAGQGCAIDFINAPSATCCNAMAKLAAFGVTHAEPGHGLLGTTPLHAAVDQPELPAIVYVSEVSHTFDGKTYCYGGGHYRRSGMSRALVGRHEASLHEVKATMPEPTGIDYHIELERAGDTGDSVVFAFRTQVFVTRSQVAVVKGIQDGTPQIIGIYDSQGNL